MLRKNLENYVGKDVRKHDRVHDVEEAECERDETEGEESTGRSAEGQGSRPLAPQLPETTVASEYSRKKSSHLHCILIKHD